MNIKVLKILGTIFAFILCFPLHYLYNYFPCFITSVVSPVNESIWEHMKILFTSILISGVIQKTYVIVSKIKFNNIFLILPRYLPKLVLHYKVKLFLLKGHQSGGLY